ncbi:MAG TPA: M48 family metalloprotease [Lacunisphaera sp.]|nr:M48 family metalloprotease [Lacunisphaera sp.]
MRTLRLSLTIPAALVAATFAFAQFGGLDLGKIKKGLDTAKDAGQVVKGVAGIGPEEERKIGEAVALELIGRYGGLVRDEETMRRVNLVGRALAKYSERPELEWQFAVLDSDTLNAFSAPGGLVFITRGLYEKAESDDVLAGILGHEIAHITNKNALKIVQRGDLVSGSKGLLLKRSSQAREINSQVSQVGSMLGFDVLGLVKKIAESGFDAPTEYTADKDGRRLAVTTGYAPGGLRAVLLNLQQNGENRKTMFATHPPVAERIKRLPDEPVPAAE